MPGTRLDRDCHGFRPIGAKVAFFLVIFTRFCYEIIHRLKLGSRVCIDGITGD